jgi:hypothetical protein
VDDEWHGCMAWHGMAWATHSFMSTESDQQRWQLGFALHYQNKQKQKQNNKKQTAADDMWDWGDADGLHACMHAGRQAGVVESCMSHGWNRIPLHDANPHGSIHPSIHSCGQLSKA